MSLFRSCEGDTRTEAIDIYDQIDLKELKESYLAHMPQLRDLRLASCLAASIGLYRS